MTQSILWGQVGLMVGVVFCTLRFLLELKFTWHHMALKFTWHHVSHDLVGVHEIFHEPCLEPWKSERWHCWDEKGSNNTVVIDEKSEGHPQNFLLFLQFFLKLDYSKVTHLLVSSSLSRGASSQNGQEIHDHPSVLQFYRYSTEEKRKVGKHNQEMNGYIKGLI